MAQLVVWKRVGDEFVRDSGRGFEATRRRANMVLAERDEGMNTI